MNTSGKWLARAGVLLVMVGFVLPTISVSCAGAPVPGGALSLANLVSLPYSSISILLYLVPVGALAVLIFSFLPASDPERNNIYWIGQIIGVSASLLSGVITLVTIYIQIGQTQLLQVSPQIGSLVLLIGYILIIMGVIFQWQELNEARLVSAAYYVGAEEHPPPVASSNEYIPGAMVSPADQLLPEARLDVLSGNVPYSVISLNSEDFTIGRSSSNNLQVPDTTVSRQHARIRYAQNTWFIQDWESTSGTYVNGRVVQATRLNPGDKIKIGENTFVFRL